MKFPAWHQRPEEFDPETHRDGILDEATFLRVADQFISLANQRNKKIEATELQMVMRHQAMQLQINDPIADDFYHHFWVVKGGQSRAKALQTKPAVISTERKKLDDEKVGASLGVGGVVHRTPDVAVRTPKKLLEVPSTSY